MVLFADGQPIVLALVGADDVKLLEDEEMPPKDDIELPTEKVVLALEDEALCEDDDMVLGPVYIDNSLVPEDVLDGIDDGMDGDIDADGVVVAPMATVIDDKLDVLTAGVVEVLGHAVSVETTEVVPPCIW